MQKKHDHLLSLKKSRHFKQLNLTGKLNFQKLNAKNIKVNVNGIQLENSPAEVNNRFVSVKNRLNDVLLKVASPGNSEKPRMVNITGSIMFMVVKADNLNLEAINGRKLGDFLSIKNEQEFKNPIEIERIQVEKIVTMKINRHLVEGKFSRCEISINISSALSYST